MARNLKSMNVRRYQTATYEGASAYDFASSQPLTHLTFTCGSALLTDTYYQSERQQVYSLIEALLKAHAVDSKFAWQYAAWMRDAKNGKGNRIQGSLVPAILDGLTDSSEHTEVYVAKCLSHRPDDVAAFVNHYDRLGLGEMSAEARCGVARALASFDEYQLMKYARPKDDIRLCDVIAMVRPELEALGAEGALALNVGAYLHASSRDRDRYLDGLPVTRARRRLWKESKSFAMDSQFASAVKSARVTWEQVFSHFGTRSTEKADTRQNHAIWHALLKVNGLMGDMAFMRNINGFSRAGIAPRVVLNHAKKRRFTEVWPHQVFAGYRAVDAAYHPAMNAIFDHMVDKLPSGRHLGIADASGSMCTRVGGINSSITARDIAFCFTGLMSETSGLGASFCDDSMMQWSSGTYLTMAQRQTRESALDFTQRSELLRGWGGTQVFGAVMELITWLKRNDHIVPPDCLWFFSDMQFHPAKGDVPKPLEAMAKKMGVSPHAAPLEVALNLYRAAFRKNVDAVLWNLAAYSPVPVPSTMKGVLLVSGFDANTFKTVERWRKSGDVGNASVEVNQQAVLNEIRRY